MCFPRGAGGGQGEQERECGGQRGAEAEVAAAAANAAGDAADAGDAEPADVGMKEHEEQELKLKQT